LADPLLVVTDGAPGLIRAVETCFPRALRQRCLVHRLRNLRSKAPESRWPEIALRARGCYEAASPALATVLRDDFVQTYARELPAVVQCFSDDFDACIAHLRFPLRHRRVVRTTNLLERLFLEERRRTKIIPHAFGERPVLKLMYAAVIRAAERWRGIASANLSSGNSERSARSSAAPMLSAWRPPSDPSRRRRSENCERTDERVETRRRIWLQIDDLGVGRYLCIRQNSDT
jgi:transposase-like protein